VHAYETVGHDGASSLISRLCEDVAFLSVSQAGIFTMHDLFREFIRQEVSRRGSKRQGQCYDEAVNILLRSEQYNDALTLLIEANDTHKLIETVEKFAGDIDQSITPLVVAETERIHPSRLGLDTLCLQTEHWSWYGEFHKSLIRAEAKRVIGQSHVRPPLDIQK
jgi:hypothetical protein